MKGFASNEPRVETSPRRAFFLPRRSPPRQGEGRAAGEKECQDRGSKEARARRLIASADGPRFGEKNDKMPEWGLTRNLIDGGWVSWSVNASFALRVSWTL